MLVEHILEQAEAMVELHLTALAVEPEDILVLVATPQIVMVVVALVLVAVVVAVVELFCLAQGRSLPVVV